MANFIDRRLNAKGKSTVNRQRFIERYKKQIKKAVGDAVTRRSVTDIDKGEQITIPKRDLSEPVFKQGQGGIRDRVHPGNDQFNRGDQIQRPKGPDMEALVKAMHQIVAKVMTILYLLFQKMNI